MPQIQLPIFSSGITLITNELGYECRDGTVTYFVGQLPIFQHPKDDVDLRNGGQVIFCEFRSSEVRRLRENGVSLSA